ncbi:hypothetical protein Sjap_007435 [Stephania japonica]|uniref:Uncharacterized protein n=1 Tax=Stephania japonica TaxID=461633 RepID=A0AAP0PDJ4_9MAGN
MSSKAPVFPVPPQPQHFSDYGFDPQIDYFQVLEEARRHKRDIFTRSIDSLHFKLQKPISKDESKKKNKSKRKRWWKNALLFWRWKWVHNGEEEEEENGYVRRSRSTYRGAISGPVYITESRSGSVTPRRSASRAASGPIAGTVTPTRRGEVEVPYFSLRDLNVVEEDDHLFAQSQSPIYLVT